MTAFVSYSVSNEDIFTARVCLSMCEFAGCKLHYLGDPVTT